MVPTESGILLKNHVIFSFVLKYYITVSFWQFMKTLNQFSDLPSAKIRLVLLFIQVVETANSFDLFS